MLFVLVVVSNAYVYAQSVRGKVIYVSPAQDVKLKFRSSVSNYSFVNKSQAAAFKIKTAGKSVHINNLLEISRPANLVVTEGSNTHLFILEYKASLDAATETVYDFSSKEKVLVKKAEEPPVQVAQVKNAEPVQMNTVVTEVPDRVETTASAEPESNKSITSVAVTPAKSIVVVEPTYSSEITKGTLAFKEKNYKIARSYFQTAQKLDPSAKYPRMRLAEIEKLMRSRRK